MPQFSQDDMSETDSMMRNTFGVGAGGGLFREAVSEMPIIAPLGFPQQSS